MSYLSHFEDIDLKFCSHNYQPFHSNLLYGFLKILILRGTILKKNRDVENVGNFNDFSKNLKSEIAIL